MADDEEAGADGEGGGDDAYDPQRALVAQSLEVNKLRQHVEVLKRANERIRDQYKQEIRSLLHPLIERHRKLQVENGKLQEKIEKLSVAPPGSDEALVEELRKLRHDHGILQKITEGLEADSRLARRLQAELEEATQRIEALDVRVADLERERRRLEMLVSERDQARVELDEQLAKAQAEQREWKEKYEKAQQTHKDDLRGYQQQLGEAIGRYKALEKQHQDALFARDLLPILYEELQAEAATYDELTALFAGARGNPDAYRPADHAFSDAGDYEVAPVTAESSFSSYQPSPEATIALATGGIAAAGMAAVDTDGIGFDVAETALPTAGDVFDDEPAASAYEMDHTAVATADVEPAMADRDPMAADPDDADVALPAPATATAAELERLDLNALGFSDDELDVLQDLTGGPDMSAFAAPDAGTAAPAFDVGGLAFGDGAGSAQESESFDLGDGTFATEAMHTGYDLAVEAERLAGDDLLALDDVLEPIDPTVAGPGFDATGFDFGQAEAQTEATASEPMLDGPADLAFGATAFNFGHQDPLAEGMADLGDAATAEPAALAFDVSGFSFGQAEPIAEAEAVLAREDDDFDFGAQDPEAGLDQLLGDATLQLGSDDYAVDPVAGLAPAGDDTVLHANDDADELGTLLGADALDVADEPLVLGTGGFDEDLAEQMASVHGGAPHPITDRPHLVLDGAATSDEATERMLIDREDWEIADDGDAVILGDATGLADEADETDAQPDFASQLAQSLSGFAETTEDDVEELIWEDGPIDEAAEQAATSGGVMFAPGAIAPTADAAPAWDVPDDEAVQLPPLEVDFEDEELSDEEAEHHDIASGWPAGGSEAAEAAAEMLPRESGLGTALQPEQTISGTAGSWAAAMAMEPVGLRHSETSISPEDIARLLDDDDDLGMAPYVAPADTDGPDFRIQPPKLEPPSLP